MRAAKDMRTRLGRLAALLLAAALVAALAAGTAAGVEGDDAQGGSNESTAEQTQPANDGGEGGNEGNGEGNAESAGAAGGESDATSPDDANANTSDAENAGASDGDAAPAPVNEDNLVDPQQLPDSSFIYDTAIADLDKADSYMDGQTVQITGEVVGDRINAGTDGAHSWLMIEAIDGSYAELAVYVPNAAADLVDTYGAYGRQGTVMQLRGTFNLSCPDHEGLSDLHAEHYAVVSKGSSAPDTLNVAKFVPGAVLLLIGGGLLLVFYRLRERQR